MSKLFYPKTARFIKSLMLIVLLFPAAIFSQTAEGWKWRFDTPNSSYANPYAGKNNIYVRQAEDIISALDAATGREKWRYKMRPDTWLDERIEAADRLILLERFETTSRKPPVADNVVGLDAATGKEIWRKDFDGSEIVAMSVSGSAVYLNVENIGLAILDAASGAIKKLTDACPDIVGTPSIDGKTVYVDCFSGKTYAINADGGNLRWQQGKRGDIYSDFVFSGDSVFLTHSAGDDDNFIFALDKNSGRERWKIPAPDTYVQQIFLENLLVTKRFTGAKISAVNPVSGKMMWQIGPDGEPPDSIDEKNEYAPDASLPTAFNRIFYFGNDSGDLFAVQPNSGKLLWRAKVSERSVQPPEIVGGKGYTIIVQNKDFYLAAINLANGKIVWQMRLYGSSYQLVQKNNLLVFASDDGKVNAVAPLEAEKLARLNKNLGAAPAVEQVIVENGGRGTGAGNGNGNLSVKNDLQAAMSGDRAYVTVSRTIGSNFYETDLKTGAKLLLFQHDAEQLSAPRTGGGMVFYLGTDYKSKNILYAFDPASGKMRWQADAPNNGGTPPVVSDKYVAYVSAIGVLYVHNFDGERILQKSLGNFNAFGSFGNRRDLISFDGDLIYYAGGSEINCFDLATGQSKWTKNLERTIGNIAGGTDAVFALSSDEILYALKKTTGEPLWQVDVGGKPSSYENSVYFADGIVFCFSEARYKTLLQAFGAADGKLLWERRADSKLNFAGDYAFTDNVGRVFEKRTGKSVFYENLLEVRKLALLDVSDKNTLIARDVSDEKNLVLAAVEWRNRNKPIWKIDFSKIDKKAIFDPRTTGE